MKPGLKDKLTSVRLLFFLTPSDSLVDFFNVSSDSDDSSFGDPLPRNSHIPKATCSGYKTS